MSIVVYIILYENCLGRFTGDIQTSLYPGLRTLAVLRRVAGTLVVRTKTARQEAPVTAIFQCWLYSVLLLLPSKVPRSAGGHVAENYLILYAFSASRAAAPLFVVKGSQRPLNSRFHDCVVSNLIPTC